MPVDRPRLRSRDSKLCAAAGGPPARRRGAALESKAVPESAVETVRLPGKMCRVYGYRVVNGGARSREFRAGHENLSREAESQRMSVIVAVVIAVAFAALAASAAFADGIEPGLWRITSRTETGGVIGPPHEVVEMPDRRAGAGPGHHILAGAEHHQFGLRADRAQPGRSAADLAADLQGPARHGADRRIQLRQPASLHRRR